MKRLLLVILLVFTLAFPAIADEGDIWLWKADGFELFGYVFPVLMWEMLLQKQLFVHADYEGPNGILYTSIQGQGSSTSTIDRRFEQFNSAFRVGKKRLLLSPDQIEAVSASAISEKVEYDYDKNYGMTLDMMFGDRDRYFTNLLGNSSDDDLVCSEAVVKWFEENGITVSDRSYKESTPNDIYEYRVQTDE